MHISLTSVFDIQDTTPDGIYTAVEASLPQLVEKLVSEVVVELGNKQMQDGTLKKQYGPVKWKDSKGKRKGKIMSRWGWIQIPHLIIQEKKTGKRHYITRQLLGLERRTFISRGVRRMLSMLGAIAPYKIAQGIIRGLTGLKTSLMSIQRSVIRQGEDLVAELQPETNHPRVFEADGTGVKIAETGKRGKEMKILTQRCNKGRLRFLGMSVDNWHGSWDGLFSRFKQKMSRWRLPVSIVTDGDHTISKTLKGVLPKGLKLHKQRCTWHIMREAMHTLWSDKHGKSHKSTKKQKLRGKILYRIKKAAEIARTIPEKRSISSRRRAGRKAMGYMRSARYLCWDNYLWKTHALLDRFIEEKSLDGSIKGEVKCTTSSHMERLMHTLKNRTSVGGCWSARGVQAVATLRLAMFYNGWGLEKIRD